ncbi:MAG: HDOD domain-containing protein [Thioalkalispiraceae bacterium]|jgi:putative nucleotidyltransferase with HDIG domain
MERTDTTQQNLLSADELVSGVVRLVSLPEVCIRVNEMLEDPNVTAKAIGKVMSQDTGLTARLLKIVNSSFYGFTSKIETVSRAVTVIGLRELRGLVLAASAIETFSKIPTDILNMVRFWRHSVYCGVVAQLLAERCNVLHSERLFVAGLLHDIGKLVICNRLPAQARQAIELSETRKIFDFEAEQDVMGYDHSEIGGKLLRSWQMPTSLCDAVEFHHVPLQAQDSLMETCIVHIANAMTGMAEQGLDADMDILIQPVLDEAWKVTGLDESIIEPTLLQAGPLFTEALESILPRSYQPY